MRNSLKNSGDTVLVIYNILDTYMKQRNGIVDIIRGCAMLLVVLGHTMSGTVREFSDSLLFQAIWTLQMPLFIVISGYVTRYSRPLEDSRGLWKFIKKRTLAYLLPWGVWTIVVRGLIFGQSNMLNIKKLLWNMDNGYWFLVTIWTISMIYGISDLLSNKWFKEKKLNVFAHFFFCGIGLIGLAVVGYLMGLNFFAIKLTIYYLPIYLLGYMYGQIQHWVMARANGKYFVNIVIVASLALWLAAINRFDFFAGADNLMMIFGRFIASSLGCIAVIGLFCKYNGEGIFKILKDRRTLVRNVSHPLSVSEPCATSPSASVSINGGNVHNIHELPANFSDDSNDYKDGTGQQHFELSVVCQTRINKILNWVGTHSLEIYLIHGFSLCFLKLTNPPVLDSCYGWLLVTLNFVVAVLLSCIYIRIIESNKLLNKILYWK